MQLFYETFFDSSQQLHFQFNEYNHHHATHVLRMKVGDELSIINGKGLEAIGEITQIVKKGTFIKFSTIHVHEQKNNIHIAISFTKNPNRMEWLLEKITEIGVREITPLITQRSEHIYFKKERFEKIMVSAMCQSHQFFLPEINSPYKLDDFIRKTHLTQKFIAHCDNSIERKPLIQISNHRDAILCIGPEGDFTKNEIKNCLTNGFQSVTLGSTRLRTETAALVACAILKTKQNE